MEYIARPAYYFESQPWIIFLHACARHVGVFTWHTHAPVTMVYSPHELRAGLRRHTTRSPQTGTRSASARSSRASRRWSGCSCCLAVDKKRDRRLYKMPMMRRAAMRRS
jgi:hypothetical protein